MSGLGDDRLSNLFGKLSKTDLVESQTRRIWRGNHAVGPSRPCATLLSRMARAGMIANVRRGLYLFPAKLPLGGVWTPDEATAINALMADKQARHQITGPNAFNRYGYDEQIPSRICIYNNAISSERTVGPIELILVKVGKDRLGDTEQIKTPSGETVIYSSRVRTLVDAVYDWSRFDSLPRAYDWIRRDIEAGRIPALTTTEPLAGANNSTQYNGAVAYQSPTTGQQESIVIEVSVREPLLMPAVTASAKTLLLAPISADAAVPAVEARCISMEEAMAEKFRAALSRKDVAIRDFYDIEYATEHLELGPGSDHMADLVL